MGSHREMKQKGKQYDHEHLSHDLKGEMKTGVLERQEGEGSGYKHPHEKSHASCKQ